MSLEMQIIWPHPHTTESETLGGVTKAVFLTYPPRGFPGGSDGKVSVYGKASVYNVVLSLGWEDSLEKEMAIHSSTIN